MAILLGGRRTAAAAAAGCILLLAACTPAPEPATPLSLDPAPGAVVWPRPPETPRYAFVRSLIGERDFAAENKARDAATRALSWIVGLIVGEPDYLELRRPVAGASDDSGRIYVADASHRAVIVFDMPARKVLKWGLAAPGVAFESPIAVAPDGRGGVLVTDSELKEVFRLDSRGRPAGRFGSGALSRPTGMVRDAASGRVYVSDTALHVIKVFDDGGALVATLGRRGNERGQFNFPTHLAAAGGELYVSDTLNFRVQVIGGGGQDRLAFGELGLFVGNMTRPKGVAVGADGRIYVVESYYDHLLVYDRDGRFLLPIKGTAADIGHFFLPSGVWTDAQGRVFLADMFNGRIVVFKELTREQRP